MKSNRDRKAALASGVALAAIMLLAGSVSAAQAQSASRSSLYDITSADIRGTTDEGTGFQNADSYASSADNAATPTPRPLLTSGDDSEQADPLVPSYAATVAPDPDAAPDVVAEEEPARATSVDAAAARQDLEDGRYGRQTLPISTVDGIETGTTPEEDLAPGIRLSTFLLRPTLTEKIVHESESYGGATFDRTFSETTLEGTLESDWSRHKLTVTGEGSYQANISGEGQEEPTASVDAVLDLDLTETLGGQLAAGYDFYREDRTDPNAIANATAQSGVHTLSASAALTKRLGSIRGTATAEVSKVLYGDAELAGGGVISGDDRDALTTGVRGRIGYEVSPALIPFLEASLARTEYDQEIDSSGFKRSSSTYGLRAGVELPLGEKLSGEISAGYLTRDIEDAGLEDIDAFTIDGSLRWSPMRGTTLTANLNTAIEASTTAGESGSVVHLLSVELERQLRDTVVARLTGTAALRNYEGASAPDDQTRLGLRGELDWSLNRYLSLVADAGYEKTTQGGVPDSDTARIGLGLRVRR
ncbi:MAG: hypothetical protein CML29_00620 [Rhizobiales bacterium]|nr:hypothetical protein [Hyphomicrobiales bacterium]